MQIERQGTVSFGDAEIDVWEDPRGRGMGLPDEYEQDFKKTVFLRIAQQLRRLGWKTEVPADMVKQYSRRFAESRRYCRHGDLQGFLSLCGRHIEFEMWQDIANISREDGNGRYEFGKEERMPYLLRLRMERTRRRLRDYLCNVFSGYEFNPRAKTGRNSKRGPAGLTALQFIDACYADSWHFKGDTTSFEISEGNRRSGDGGRLEHGCRVWFYDRKGRACTGIAYYNINNMWWVVTGKYGVNNVASFHLFTTPPEHPRRKLNAKLRRKRLESELSRAVAAMDFSRAEILKRLLFPTPEPVYRIYHTEHKAWHGPGFSGYSTDKVRAGLFTQEEATRFTSRSTINEMVPVEGAA